MKFSETLKKAIRTEPKRKTRKYKIFEKNIEIAQALTKQKKMKAKLENGNIKP